MKKEVLVSSKTFFLKIYAYILFTFFFILILGCGPNTNQPDLSAIPHADALPSTELSSADKAKLLEASGKTIDQISERDLQNMLAASDGQLHVYAFWNSSCEKCLKNIESLKSYFAGTDSEKVRIITINIGDDIKTANLILRSNSIVFESYQLKTMTNNWNKSIDEEWNGELPALFMVNKAEDLFLKYYKLMSENEMEAILQTLII